METIERQWVAEGYKTVDLYIWFCEEMGCFGGLEYYNQYTGWNRIGFEELNNPKYRLRKTGIQIFQAIEDEVGLCEIGITRKLNGVKYV